MKLPLLRCATSLKTAGNIKRDKDIRMFALSVGFFVAAFISLSGCYGPRLRIADLQIQDRTDNSVHYTVTVANVEERTDFFTRLFCRQEEADGEVFWQGYLSASQSASEVDKIPAGGVAVVSQTLPTVRDKLAPGETVSGTLNATVAVDPIQHPYLYVELRSLSAPEKKPRTNSYCAK